MIPKIIINRRLPRLVVIIKGQKTKIEEIIHVNHIIVFRLSEKKGNLTCPLRVFLTFEEGSKYSIKRLKIRLLTNKVEFMAVISDRNTSNIIIKGPIKDK